MLKSLHITGAALAVACIIAGGVAQADDEPPAVKTPDDEVVCFFAKRYVYGMRCVSLVTGNGFRVGPRMRPVMIDGAKLRRCGSPAADGAGVFDVRARRIACARARRIARTFYEDRDVPGWSCRERQLDLEHFRVRCTRGSRLVRFEHGS